MKKGKKFSRLMSLLLAVCMVFTMMPAVAWADEGDAGGTSTAADPISVYVTVSNKGELAVAKDGNPMGYREVTVTDLDASGDFTVDEALQAAHEQYYGENGYTATDSQYGLQVTKLWGEETTGCLFWVNKTSLANDVGTDTITNGQHLVAAILSDTSSWSDCYTDFTSNANVNATASGSNINLWLKSTVAFSDSLSYAEGLQLTVWNSTTKEFDQVEDAVTNSSGKATISFDTPGTYYVSATGTYGGNPIIAPVYVAKIKAADQSVSVTINNNGTIAETKNSGEAAFKLPISAKDKDEDGNITYGEALYYAHTSSKGSTGGSSDYVEAGGVITKLWGVESAEYVLYRNGNVVNASAEVNTGDELYVHIKQDEGEYILGEFDTDAKTVEPGAELTLTLTSETSTGVLPLEDAQIGKWSCGVFTPIEGKKTDSEGKVTLSFNETGVYNITAYGEATAGEKQYKVLASVCNVIVEKKATVKIRAQEAGTFLYTNDELVVKNSTAESYGYEDTPGIITALDVLVAAHEAEYGMYFGWMSDNYLVMGNGNPIKMFGIETKKFSGFAINHAYPMDGSGTGYVVNTAPVEDGDIVEFFYYEDPSYYDYLTWFEDTEGNKVDKLVVKDGEEVELKLKGFAFMYNYSAAPETITAAEAGTLLIKDGNGNTLCDVSTAVDGVFKIKFGTTGTNYITAEGKTKEGYKVILPYAKINVTGVTSGFTVTSNTLNPEFSADKTEYKLGSVLEASKNLTVKWTYSASMTGKAVYTKVDGTLASVTVGNNKNTSIGSLKAGTTKVTFTFTEDGSEPLEYTLTVEKLPGISKLSVTDDGSELTLSSAFNATTKSYTSTALVGSNIKFTPTFNEAKNTELYVKVNDGEYAKYSDDGYTLANGENIFTIKSKSKDGTTEGTEYTITIEGVEAAENAAFTVSEGATVYIYDPVNNDLVSLGEAVTEDGKDTYTLSGLLSNNTYTYRVGKYGYFSKSGTFTAGENVTVTLTESDVPATTVSSEWKNFRNSDTNNGVVNLETPRNADETALKWVSAETTKESIGSQVASGAPMLIVNDYLITTQGTKLVKIDRETGKIVKSQAMDSGNGNLGNAPMAFGGDMIFVPLFNGKVQAFDAETLKPVWISESLGTQCTTALVYDNGYIYGSTGNLAPAAFFCLNAADEDKNSDNEIKTATLFISDNVYTKGSYWSTPLVIGNYVVYGTDAGTDGNAAIISRDKKTGELISKSILTGLGDQRSSLVYSENIDTIYFTAKNAKGGLCKVSFNETTGVLGEVAAFESATQYTGTTSSPVVYNGTIYFSANAGFNKAKYVIAVDERTFTEKYKTEFILKTSGGVQSSALITTAYESTDNAVYLYVTQNIKPGELYVVKDDGTSMTLESLLTLSTDYQEANIASAIADSDGTLYFRNDSGYIFALEKVAVSTAAKQKVTFKITDAAGTAVTGVTMEVLNADNTAQSYAAESDGSYLLAPGEYKYTATKKNYETASGSFTVTDKELTDILVVMKTGDEVTTPETTENVVTVTVKGYDGKANYSATKLNYVSGMTAFSALQSVVDSVEWRSTEFGTYVAGIDGLTEFDYGSGSGWMYTVNGVAPQYSSANYALNKGDNVVWVYTTDLGIDVGLGKPEEEKNEVTTSPAAGGAGGSTVTTTTTPTEVTVSGTTATATITKENVTETLKQATENKSAEIVVQVSASDSKGAANVKVQLDTATVKDIVDDTDAALTVKTENGTVSLDQETLKTVVSEAKGSTITLEVVKVDKPAEHHKKAAGENGHIIQLVIKSGGKTISAFNEGKATVTVEIPAKLTGKKVAAIHIADDGTIEHLKGHEVTVGGKKHYRFDTPHFSTFALVDADEIGLEVEDETTLTADEVKALLADLSPVARSSKTAKKNVKITLKLDAADKAIIEQLEAAGCTVKYNFYRSTKKASKYTSRLIKDTAVYTQTGGTKNKMYYYKARIQVYDGDGNLVGRTELKQCKYANRKWTK